MANDFDIAVIGAGAVGLACAARLARAGRSVVVIERLRGVGLETSGRNSGVIHAGLYYPEHSLKARLCVRGRELLYARCVRDGVAHRRCGKIVVANTNEELAKLDAIFQRGTANGAGPLRMLDAREVRRLEPRVRAIAGVWSPETGIVDAAGLMESYKNEAMGRGAALCFLTDVIGLAHSAQGFAVRTRSQAGEEFSIRVARVVNCAGLNSDKLAESAGIPIDALGYRLHYCKGDYFSVAPRLRGIVQHLIYPVPDDAGLGIHVTFDMSGKLMAGPDTEPVDDARYDIDPSKAKVFGAAVRRYLPELLDDDLSPDFSGVRPKLQGPGQPPADFVIEEASAHGLPGLINLIGIESPGLTASDAVAEYVHRLVEDC